MKVRSKGKLLVTVVLVLLCAMAGAMLAGELFSLLLRGTPLAGDPSTVAELTVMEYADAHGLSYGDYPQSLIELLERNPETEEFVLEYPIYEQEDFDLSEYEDCETVPLFLQWDQRWGYTQYGSDVMGITGCGPTCLAMAGYYLTGDAAFAPNVVAEFAEQNGYYEPGYGSSWTLISEGGEALGLDVTEIPLDEARINANLEVGNPIICAMRAGDFTTTGHYIVLAGMEDGLFPSSMAINSDDPEGAIEEERRLCYVAITRAKQTLTICHAKQRMLYGRTNAALASRFLREIPEQYILRKGAKFNADERTQGRFGSTLLLPLPVQLLIARGRCCLGAAFGRFTKKHAIFLGNGHWKNLP